MREEIIVQVNGEPRRTTAGSTVTSLLAELGMNAGRVAVEYNLQILPRAQWEATRIRSGDRLEIVQFVGGG